MQQFWRSLLYQRRFKYIIYFKYEWLPSFFLKPFGGPDLFRFLSMTYLACCMLSMSMLIRDWMNGPMSPRLSCHLPYGCSCGLVLLFVAIVAVFSCLSVNCCSCLHEWVLGFCFEWRSGENAPGRRAVQAPQWGSPLIFSFPPLLFILASRHVFEISQVLLVNGLTFSYVLIVLSVVNQKTFFNWMSFKRAFTHSLCLKEFIDYHSNSHLQFTTCLFVLLRLFLNSFNAMLLPQGFCESPSIKLDE